MRGDAGGAARRRWAWAALVSLLLIVGGLGAVAVLSGGGLVGLVAIAALSVAVVAATAWWAFTTSRVWKRRLNIALAVLVVATVVVGVVAVGLRAVGGVAAVGRPRGAGGGVGRGGPPGAWAPGPPPARPWLLVNPGSGGGKAARLGL